MKISDNLSSIAHRPWSLPSGQWEYYQEWNNALFLHWAIPYNKLKPLIPEGLELDTVNGISWISLVAFTMENIRPKNFPALPFISNFHEINFRAYVTRDSKPGVYFLTIEAGKLMAVIIARALSGLPYEKASIRREQQGRLSTYTSHNKLKNFHLAAGYEIENMAYEKTALDRWLTERYCLYIDHVGGLYRYEIHHQEWGLKKVKLQQFKLHYEKGNVLLKNKPPDMLHFSEGVNVLAWGRRKV